MTTKDEIIGTLSVVDNDLATRVVGRYLEMRTLESVRRWEDCLDEAGKFAEEVYRFVHLAVKGTPIAEVEDMDNLRKKLENPGKPAPESLRLLVPRIAQPAENILHRAKVIQEINRYGGRERFRLLVQSQVARQAISDG